MIKECKVLFYNSYLSIIVVNFDGKIIQMTGKIDEGSETIYVKYENGIATVSSKEELEKFLKPRSEKKSKKIKAIETDLVEDVIESEAVKDETDEVSE